MFGYLRSEIRGQKTYGLRVQSSLKNQIKADYRELIGLWNVFKNETTDIESGERILEKISWIKIGINEFKDINRSDIEGLNWGELETIEVNVQSMEREVEWNNFLRK